MKTLALCLSVLMLALTAMALPLIGAGDVVKADPANRAPRDEAGSVGLSLRDGLGDPTQGAPRDEAGLIRVAQARPEKEKSPRSTTPNAKSTTPNAKGPARKETAKNTSSAKSKRAIPITAEMESEVGKFVSEHHRELVDVLAHLKANVPKEYERALRDLNRNRLRLQQLEGRDRYAAELELWKVQSRARLLGARVQMGDAEGSRESLRKTLAEIYDLRAALLQRDRERTVERLKKLDEQLEALRNDRDENLEKQLLALTKTTQKRTKSVTTSARNAKPAPSKKTPVKKTPVKKTSAKTIK